MSTVGIGGALRTVNRARQIVTVLVRFGFEDLATDLGLVDLIASGRKLVGLARKGQVESLSEAERVRGVLEELGPTFIKLGQVLSTRPDLVPSEWAVEFRLLRSNVPAEPWSEIDAFLDEEYGALRSEYFRSIESEPLAAASIAQVHRAVLLDGTPVALKILRPGVRETIRADIDILTRLAQLVERRFKHFGYSAVEVVRQYAREIEREVDLRMEAYNTQRMRRDFEDLDGITFPLVFTRESTRSVLVLELIEGTLLANLDPSSRSSESLQLIAEHFATLVFRQCLEIGFFHADPHPGNIFVTGDDSLCFIDCGMTGRLDPDSVELLADFVHAVIEADLDRVVHSAVMLADADPAKAHNRALRSEAWALIDRFRVASLGELQVGDLLESFFEMARHHDLRCPADLVYLIKVITTVEGTVEEIVPEFNAIQHARPYLENLIRRRYGPAALGRRVRRGLGGYMQFVEELPNHLRELFRSVRQKQVSLNVEHKGLDKLTETIERSSINVSYGLTVAALIVGSALLVLADAAEEESTWLTVLAAVGFTSAFGLALLRTLTVKIGRR